MSASEAAREGRLRGVEAAIIDCCRRWAQENPEDLLAFKAQIQHQRQTMARDKGFSHDKQFLSFAQVPVKLYRMMQREIEWRWDLIPEIRDRFYAVFKVGCLSKAALSRR